MLLYISDTIKEFGFSVMVANILAVISLLLAIIGVSFLIHFILKRYIMRLYHAKVDMKNKPLWNRLFIKYGTFNHIYFLVHIVQSEELPFTKLLNQIIQKFLIICIIIISVLLIFSVLNIINDIYQRSFLVAKQRPIKSYIDFLKIVAWIIGGIFIVSTIANASPVTMLAGLGALGAGLVVFFKDSIFGFISSIQLAAYDIVRIGDWIQIKNFNVDGDVLDISLNTVKVQNFDKTIVTIPTYELIRNGVINWRGMRESGGRRIKRSINIDMDTIKFCDNELLNNLSKIECLSHYIKQAQKEYIIYYKERLKNEEFIQYDKILTNVRLYRTYIKAYLNSRIDIHRENFTFLVRQLQPTEVGLPIQLYTFTTTVNWNAYEDIQSDIFDHIISMLPVFRLKAFQNSDKIEIISKPNQNKNYFQKNTRIKSSTEQKKTIE